ncbi:hypothetical protein DM02DRAFT_82875 [Periconia macrospinosa]|uniref:Uncharacterized protein n=1 Tax=Periconia macrospinosa TaxID=97972 RepID=A0A2V1DHD9_9PLEO|nr:hypothetical protein DM02DRAFT_82875 [Periconia macrospinosa]
MVFCLFALRFVCGNTLFRAFTLFPYAVLLAFLNFLLFLGGPNCSLFFYTIRLGWLHCLFCIIATVAKYCSTITQCFCLFLWRGNLSNFLRRYPKGWKSVCHFHICLLSRLSLSSIGILFYLIRFSYEKFFLLSLSLHPSSHQHIPLDGHCIRDTANFSTFSGLSFKRFRLYIQLALLHTRKKI